MRCNIEAERARHQMTKEEMCKCLGVSFKTYLRYVRSETPIPSDVLEKMAQMFDCSVDYILGLTDIPDKAG